ncbi:MAG: M1 family aminopeptidase [Thiofilum sp.]|uniref:M1 family metallopeptidase n=1 Tax=Thiofilum sp. TaxID=2212733 RepID=UPI0025E1ED1F|nr:M1 family aminopeptidase [Thiofilum sp.]MBK8452952.1 hypothetical protein [Thiofilum sp.]
MSTLTNSLAQAFSTYYPLILKWLVVLLSCLVGYNALAANTPASPLVLQHELVVLPDLTQGHLTIRDTITLPDTLGAVLKVNLNPNLVITHSSQALVALTREANKAVYQFTLTEHSKPLVVEYQGKLNSTPDCNWLQESCLMLNSQGLYLDPASEWYLSNSEVLHTFKMTVQLPKDWLSLSQGINQANTWQELHPQTGIYLIAAPFKHYHKTHANIEYSVYLKQADPALAERYLDASIKHLTTLETLLGQYPYTKFAVVESFWETGWGMPSFTLLGSRVLRLPFILDTSLPHEIAHNWWGNSVYIDSRYGNWAEGLTAYVADHAQSALKGEDVNYRRNQLIKLSTYLKDHPNQTLNTFTSRHDNTSQALGYSKSTLLFHMLNKTLGEATFLKALQTFYQRYAFKSANFKQLEQVFSEVGQRDLSTFFQQWRDQSAIPQLEWVEAKLLSPQQVALTVRQTNPDFKGYITLPVVINSQSTHPEESSITLSAAEQRFVLATQYPAQTIALDPYFDSLRLPLAEEIPPTLDYFNSANTGKKTILIAHQARPEMLQAWQQVAQQLQSQHPDWKIQLDNQPLPDGDVIILGGESDALPRLVEQTQSYAQLNQANDLLGRENYLCGLHTLALTLRLKDRYVLALSADHVVGLTRLMAKLPHYGSYSYALFNSTDGANIAKGQWEVLDSPLMKVLQP